MGNQRKVIRKSYRKKFELSGQKITLRKTGIEHTDGLYKQVITPGVMDNLTIDIEDKDEFRRYIIFITNQWKLNQNFTYTIIENISRSIIGQISIYNISFSHRRGEMGIWIGNSWWKCGYGGEALQLLIDHAFRELTINRLQCHIFISNKRSISLFQKMGFQQEGLNRQYVLKDDEFRDVYSYSLLHEQWALIKERKDNIF